MKYDPEYPYQAFAEGWCLSTCSGSQLVPDGWLDLQRLDKAGVFDTDLEAVAFVTSKAVEGSDYHMSAWDYMEHYNFTLFKDMQKDYNKLLDLRNCL